MQHEVDDEHDEGEAPGAADVGLDLDVAEQPNCKTGLCRRFGCSRLGILVGASAVGRPCSPSFACTSTTPPESVTPVAPEADTGAGKKPAIWRPCLLRRQIGMTNTKIRRVLPPPMGMPRGMPDLAAAGAGPRPAPVLGPAAATWVMMAAVLVATPPPMGMVAVPKAIPGHAWASP
jgi:hypothetical protein